MADLPELELLPLPTRTLDDSSNSGLVSSKLEPPDRLRILSEAEVASLTPIFSAEGAMMPNPANSFFVGVVEDGVVKAFLCVQTTIHAEPMWVERGYEREYMPMVKLAEAEILRRVGPNVVYAFTPPGKLTRIAQMAGMKPEPWVVLSKFVAEEPEADELSPAVLEQAYQEVHIGKDGPPIPMTDDAAREGTVQ